MIRSVLQERFSDLIAIVKVSMSLRQIPLMCTHKLGEIRIGFP